MLSCAIGACVLVLAGLSRPCISNARVSMKGLVMLGWRSSEVGGIGNAGGASTCFPVPSTVR
eukprot:5960243-Alexandrium_andersonii.AAC.1